MLRGNQIEIIKMCGGIDFEMLFFFLLWCSSEHAEFISVSLFHNLMRLRDCHPIFYPRDQRFWKRKFSDCKSEKLRGPMMIAA